MASRKKTIERADELQGSSVAAWYLAACFLVVMLGGIWVADTIGWVKIGSEQGPAFDKATAEAAARKAVAREVQARLAAQQEARNLAEDSGRQVVVSASPVATANAKVEAGPEDQETGTKESK